jgi:hypothetical protein
MFLSVALVSLVAAVVVADTPKPPSTVVPGTRVNRGVHINSVRVEGACSTPARFTVEIVNNTGRLVHLGTVFVGSANSPGNRAGNPSADFRNLAAGERRTLTLTSHWQVQCTDGETGPQCFEVGIVMEPDGTANGETWDQVWHRVCRNAKAKGAVFIDTTFTR